MRVMAMAIDHRAGSGAERHGDRHRQDQVREGLQEFDDALAEQVEAPAEEAAGQPPQRAERRPQQHRRNRDGQRDAAAVDDAAQHVASDLVGAEPGQLVRRLPHPAEICHQRIGRRDQRREDGDEHDRRPHYAPERRERRAPREGQERRAHAARQPRPGPDRGNDGRGRCNGGGSDGGRGRAHRSRILGSSQAISTSTRMFSATNTTA
jgi:hypothetical protein